MRLIGICSFIIFIVMGFVLIIKAYYPILKSNTDKKVSQENKINSLVNYEPFFSRYKPKDIVYPGAVARHFSITAKEAYNLCQSRVGKDLRPIYMIKCPVCNQTLHGRYYSIPSIDTEYEYGCTSCDTEFSVNLEENVVVNFEKI